MTEKGEYLLSILNSTSVNTIIWVMTIGVLVWTLLSIALFNKKIWKTINGVLLFVSVVGILQYTVLGRSSSSNHVFVMILQEHEDPIWEMGMNAFLYFPFGLTLTVLVGKWSIVIALFLSVTIEAWQFLFGTGLAQGTDIIMNTLGTVIGALPFFVVILVKWIEVKCVESKNKTNDTQE